MINKKQKSIENVFNSISKVIYKEKDTKYNTPIKIKYEKRLLKMNSKDYLNKIESNWKCENYRVLKDKSKNRDRFFDEAIKSIKLILEDKYRLSI